MPYLDRICFWRAPEPVATSEAADLFNTRLERIVAKLKKGPETSTMEATLCAMEGEYSVPLYDSSVYLSSEADPTEA